LRTRPPKWARAALKCAWTILAGMTREPTRYAREAALTHISNLPFRLTRPWSAIACMGLVDVTECSLVGARSRNKQTRLCKMS
jgi:hypothetical protein